MHFSSFRFRRRSRIVKIFFRKQARSGKRCGLYYKIATSLTPLQRLICNYCSFADASFNTCRYRQKDITNLFKQYRHTSKKERTRRMYRNLPEKPCSTQTRDITFIFTGSAVSFSRTWFHNALMKMRKKDVF